MKDVGMVIFWVCVLAVVVWKVLYGGVVVIQYLLPRSYLSAVWPIRDLDDEVSYSLDIESDELECSECFCYDAYNMSKNTHTEVLIVSYF